MNFKNIIGNDNNKNLLNEIIKSNNISHSYMFLGISGIGKLLFAKEFAKAILCEEQIGCSKCKSCIEFEGLNNPDFQIIEPEESSIKIEQIRKMSNKIYEKPIISKRKVYIINDADLMTLDAQNCLLKTLEEPPEYAVIILIGTNENIFLNTIRSRCVKINFNKIGDEELKDILISKYEYSNIPENMLKLFSGSLGKAINLKDKENIYVEIEEIFSNIENINIIDLLNKKEIIIKNKDEIINILEYINVLFFDKLKQADNKNRYIHAIQVVEDTKDRIKKNANLDMTIDNLLMNLWKKGVLYEKYSRRKI